MGVLAVCRMHCAARACLGRVVRGFVTKDKSKRALVKQQKLLLFGKDKEKRKAKQRCQTSPPLLSITKYFTSVHTGTTKSDQQFALFDVFFFSLFV